MCGRRTSLILMPQDLYTSLLERLEGRPYSNYFSAWCVWDTHSTPAMLVYEDGMVKCLSCNRFWNHRQLDKKIGSHFVPNQRSNTVSNILPAWKKWEREYGDLEGIADAAHKSLKRNPAFQTYFKKRKIYEYVEEGHLGYLDGWVTFPVFDMRNILCDIVVRSTSRRSDTRYVIRPNLGSARPLYIPSPDRVNQSQTIYVVYGIVDAISLHLAGLPAVTGTTGKSLSAELLRLMNKRFIIVPDMGEEAEAHKLANKLGWRCSVKELDYPDDEHKDPDSIRRDFGNQKLLQFIGATL